MEREREGGIIATQYQSLLTRNYPANIMKNGSNPLKDCADKKQKKNKNDSTDHLIFDGPILTSIEYKERHDKIRHYIH